MQDRLSVIKGASSARGARQAVDELAAQIQQSAPRIVIFFCSPHYDLQALGAAQEQRFDCQVIGCTSAGEITAETGYQQGDIRWALPIIWSSR